MICAVFVSIPVYTCSSFPASLHCLRLDLKAWSTLRAPTTAEKKPLKGKIVARPLQTFAELQHLPMALLFRYNGQYLLCGQDTFFLPYVSFALSKLHEMVFMSFLESFKCICCCSCGGLDFASVCINWSKQFTASILPPIETQRTNKNTE